MSELLAVILWAVAGAVTGLVFFAGLWLTLRRLPSSGRPGLLAALSAAGRLALAVGVLLLAGLTGSWMRLLGCLTGFTAARWFLVRRLRSKGPLPGGSAGGPSAQGASADVPSPDPRQA